MFVLLCVIVLLLLCILLVLAPKLLCFFIPCGLAIGTFCIMNPASSNETGAAVITAIMVFLSMLILSCFIAKEAK
jgi:hypothetical protein